MDVIVRPHLLSSREVTTLELPEGTSIDAMVAAHAWAPGMEQHVCALIDGIIVPRAWWPRVKPKAGARVMLAVSLHGGGGGGQGQQSGGKQMMQLVAIIVLAVVSQGAGAALATTTISAGTISAGIMLVGSLALSALFKPPSIKVGAAAEQSNTYNFSGQSNQIKPYGVIPRVLGTHRVFGDVAANPYTQLVGADQYLVAVYCFGYGPCDINDIRIGENPIDQYRPEIVIHPAFKRGDALKLYSNDVVQDPLALALKQNVPVTITTRPSTDSASFDMAFSQGLSHFDSNIYINGWLPEDASTRVEFKRASDPDTAWQPYTNAVAVTVSQGNEAKVFAINTVDYPEWPGQDSYFRRGWIAAGTTVLSVGMLDWNAEEDVPLGIGSTLVIEGHKYTVTSWDFAQQQTGITPPIVADIFRDYNTWVWPYYNRVAGYYQGGNVDTWEITDNKQTPFMVSMSLRYADLDQWQIRITQLEGDDDANLSYYHKRTVVALRSMQRSGTISPDHPIALLEIKIKATDQLSGVIQNLNALVSARVKKWDGAAWVPDQRTSNPAWLYLEVLQGAANNRPVPDERIDFPALIAWGAWCDTIRAGFVGPNAMCDFVVDTSYTVWDLLSSIAANGRAMPAMRDNKYSVIVDEADKQPVQIFTPRNSWGLTARRKYVQQPDALRVKWIDPQIGYQESLALVFNDGFDESNALAYEELSTFGVTRYEQAHREGRIVLARGQLQQEEFSITTDVENVICTRGDAIGIAHDVMQVGGWSARIATLNGNVIGFDAELKPFDPPLAIRHRDDAGVLSGVLPMGPQGGQPGKWNVPNLPNSAKVGDLVIYGTQTREMGLYLVKGIQPGNDLTAEIQCVEYAPGIYDAELGPIPPYVPQEGSVGAIQPASVISLQGWFTSYYIGRFPYVDITLQWSPPQGGSIPPSLYIINIVNPDGSTSEVTRTNALTAVALAGLPVWLTPYANTTQTFEVVPQWPGVRGPPQRVAVPLSIAVPLPPPGLVNLKATPHARGVLVTWDASTAEDIAYYVIRYGAPGDAWADMVATEQKIKANRTDLPATFLAGDWQVMALQESTFGGVRGPASSASFTILSPRSVPITGTAVQNTAFLRWGSLALVEAGTWNAQTTFQIEYYELIKQHQPAALSSLRTLPHSAGIIPAGVHTAQDLADARADQPQQLGRYSGEFAVMNEQQEGLWQYCVRGVDLAGNLAPYSCLTLLVTSPDNYFLLDHVDNLLPTPECVKTNTVYRTSTTDWMSPIDAAQTWGTHYTANTWDQPQDQVDAAFPIYAQPAEAIGLCSWTHDYAQALPSLRATVEIAYSTLGTGAPVVTVIVYAKANAGDAWVEIGRNPIAVAVLLPPGTRYVRADAQVQSDAAHHAFALLEKMTYTLDVQFRTDSGKVTTPAGGSAVVNFNVPFLDVRSVQLTSNDAAVAYARYQVATDQRSMTVYTFNATGAPVGGTVAWLASGV